MNQRVNRRRARNREAGRTGSRTTSDRNRRSLREADRREGGAISIELLFLVPFVVLPLMLFALYAGRLGMMSLRVERAAREAARAASQRLDPEPARTIAQQTIVDSLGEAQWSRCASSPRTLIDTEGVGPQIEGYNDQGVVTVTLSCTLDLSVFGPLITTQRTFTTTAIESVDEYRSRAPQ